MSTIHHVSHSPCPLGHISPCHPQVTRPEELNQKVFLVLLEHTVARGASTPGQIRRSYLTLQHDEQGRRNIRVHGNARRKTMPGRAGDYRAIDVTVYGELEVIIRQTWKNFGNSSGNTLWKFVVEILWEILREYFGNTLENTSTFVLQG